MQESKLNELQVRRVSAHLGGGESRIESQHKRGKLTARERLMGLFDDDSFTELDTFVTHRSIELGLEKQKFEGGIVDEVIETFLADQPSGSVVCVSEEYYSKAY